MTKKEIALNAVQALKNEYPEAICSLQYTDPLQLLIATRLAAQCTDARVNMVTPEQFKRFPTVDDFAKATAEEVAEYIKSCGLYKTKSRDIVEMAKTLKEKFGGVVPDNIDDLINILNTTDWNSQGFLVGGRLIFGQRSLSNAYILV